MFIRLMEQNNKIKAWHPDFEDWIELSKITIQCIIQNTQFNSFYPGSLHVFYSTPFPQETISRILIQTNQCTYIFLKVCMQYKRKWIDLNVYYMQYLFYYNSIHRMWGKKHALVGSAGARPCAYHAVVFNLIYLLTRH